MARGNMRAAVMWISDTIAARSEAGSATTMTPDLLALGPISPISPIRPIGPIGSGRDMPCRARWCKLR